MSDRIISMSTDELADVLRHHLFIHEVLDPWDKLGPERLKIWRDKAARSIAGLEGRRASVGRDDRRRPRR